MVCGLTLHIPGQSLWQIDLCLTLWLLITTIVVLVCFISRLNMLNIRNCYWEWKVCLKINICKCLVTNMSNFRPVEVVDRGSYNYYFNHHEISTTCSLVTKFHSADFKFFAIKNRDIAVYFTVSTEISKLVSNPRIKNSKPWIFRSTDSVDSYRRIWFARRNVTFSVNVDNYRMILELYKGHSVFHGYF